MFRYHLLSIQRRLSNKPNPYFSTFTASFAPSKHPFPINPKDAHHSLRFPQSPHLIPLQNLFDRKEITLTHRKTQQSSSPLSPEIAYPFFSSISENYDFLVQKYQFAYGHNDAEQLHLNMIKNGLVKDLFLSNTLINIYVRIGDLVSAQYLFDEMPEKNSVTWSCLISGYTHNDMPSEACYMFREMNCEGFVPNHYAIGSALRACQVMGSSGSTFGLQIHGLVSKTRYGFDVVVCNGLIAMYGNCMDSADYAWRVFDGIRVKNSISWNSIISVYAQRGDAFSTFELFSSMQQEGSGFSFKPTEYTCGSLITAAASSVDCGLFLLEELLARTEKSGFVQDLYVASAFVSGFARFGLLDTAKKIFECMRVRNLVSMNGLMVGLVKQRQGEEAAKIFVDMKDLIRINSDSYVVLLSSFAEFSLLEEGIRKGKEVHAFVIRTDLSSYNIALGNGLINMYAKCGAVNHACSVFRLMDNKDSVSWNSMISGLDQNGCFGDAFTSFREMKRTGLMPSIFTLISTLSSSGSLGGIRMGEQIHCEGLKLGLDLDVSVSNALLSLYADTGCITKIKKVFSLMPDYDQVSWNSIIGAFSDSEDSISQATGYFIQMMRAGWSLNQVTFINILAAATSCCFHELTRQIHALVIKYHAMEDTAIDNALLCCYGKCGEMGECEIIFSRMEQRRDDVSWNAMISGDRHNELVYRVKDVVWRMLQKGQKLDSFTFATVLSARTSVATLDHGMEIHACGIRACLESDVVVGSALVDMYSKCGRLDYASRFFELMPLRNVYSWNSMIAGYARHGQGDKALESFTKMKIAGQPPDHVTFVGVLSACSHVGLVKQGFAHFDSMSKLYGLTPCIEHFSCMVDILGRAGELDKIEDFLNKMPMKPNVLMWRTVLGACSRANGRKTDLGRRAAEMLFELEPQNAVNYVLLANMYAGGGKWEDVAKARVAMREAEVKKETGCSWVTMKDGVHVFVAGDKSHPEKGAIYEKLRELDKKMRDAGYIPQIQFTLYDLELENKEELLSYHSEKLAVAFVLTRKSELPIRIMKNLRVCGDCHSAFKYISQIAGRHIVLRDSNRFHHFLDGKCSCNDYW